MDEADLDITDVHENFTKAIEEFHEMREPAFACYTNNLGCGAIFFRGIPSEFYDMKRFVYFLRDLPFPGYETE